MIPPPDFPAGDFFFSVALRQAPNRRITSKGNSRFLRRERRSYPRRGGPARASPLTIAKLPRCGKTGAPALQGQSADGKFPAEPKPTAALCAAAQSCRFARQNRHNPKAVRKPRSKSYRPRSARQRKNFPQKPARDPRSEIARAQARATTRRLRGKPNFKGETT